MVLKRGALSLSGIEGGLMAVGGWNQESLKTVEKYSLAQNKWKTQSPLNEARQCPGTIIL